MNVSSTFQEFLQNLAIDNKEEISDRYGEITKVLNIKYRNTESKTSNSLQVGSYGRFTAIKNISDLDMVYILPWTEYERFKNDRQSALLQEVKKTIPVKYTRPPAFVKWWVFTKQNKNNFFNTNAYKNSLFLNVILDNIQFHDL